METKKLFGGKVKGFGGVHHLKPEVWKSHTRARHITKHATWHMSTSTDVINLE